MFWPAIFAGGLLVLLAIGLENKKHYCGHCGTETQKGAKVCAGCGGRFS